MPSHVLKENSDVMSDEASNVSKGCANVPIFPPKCGTRNNFSAPEWRERCARFTIRLEKNQFIDVWQIWGATKLMDRMGMMLFMGYVNAKKIN